MFFLLVFEDENKIPGSFLEKERKSEETIKSPGDQGRGSDTKFSKGVKIEFLISPLE